MNKNIDLEVIELYRDSDFYLGKYKKGSSAYFGISPRSNNVWRIIPYGSSSWNNYDQDLWFGGDLDVVKESEVPDWLPPIPTIEELKAVPSILWADNFRGKGIYPAEEYPNLNKYFETNSIADLKLYFALTEDMYESKLGDGIFRYLKIVSFNSEEITNYIANLPPSSDNTYGIIGYFKEHNIHFDGTNFTIPDFGPQLFEHYQQDELMEKVEELVKLDNWKE